MLKRIAKLTAPFLLAAAMVAGGASLAQAASGQQWNQNGTGAYINAFGGNVQGNLIKINVGKTINDDFTLVSAGGGNYQLLFTGTGSGTGSNCISDNGNSSGDAKAALWNCSGGAPWGSLFTVQACGTRGTGYYLKNNHWSGGYLNAANNNQGTQIFLNGPATCYLREGI